MDEEKVEISHSEELGRYLVAKRDLKKGELLLSDNARVICPNWGAEMCCLNCYRKAWRICKTCKMAPLCKSCTEHPSFECNFFKYSGWDKNLLIDHFNLITPLRIFLLSSSDPESFEEILKMESPCKIRQGTGIWKTIQKSVVEPLMALNLDKLLPKLKDKLDEDLIQKICGIMDVNTFEVRGSKELEIENQNAVAPSFIMRGLFVRPSFISHSCISNTIITLDSSFELRVYASLDIKKGDMILYNYTRVLLGTKQRQEHLYQGKYFTCRCRRCMDPTELGTHLSSIRCLGCSDGLCCFFEKENAWKCLACGHLPSPDYVNELHRSAEREILGAELDLKDMERAIAKWSASLNPHHWLVLEVKQSLASALRTLCGEGLRSSTRLLRRKLELCEEIIPIIRVLKPGVCRMTGIALYEFQLSLVQLSQKRFEGGEIDEQAFLESLLRAEQALRESITHLVFEHKTTPEGQLCKRALVNLKDLRGLVEEVRGMAEEKREKCERQKKGKRKGKK